MHFTERLLCRNSRDACWSSGGNFIRLLLSRALAGSQSTVIAIAFAVSAAHVSQNSFVRTRHHDQLLFSRYIPDIRCMDHDNSNAWTTRIAMMERSHDWRDLDAAVCDLMHIARFRVHARRKSNLPGHETCIWTSGSHAPRDDTHATMTTRLGPPGY